MKNFEVYCYLKSIKILKDASEIKPVKEQYPTLNVFAGANASGKSTLIAYLYNNKKMIVPYVNADVYVKFKFNKIKDENKRNIKGMYYTMRLFKKLIKKRVSFCYETVLSHESKLELIGLAKRKGYNINSTFVLTDSPEINLKRLETRVANGGHNVPHEKVIKRYYRSLKLSAELKKISDSFTIFNNSKDLEIKMLKNENEI